MQIRPDARLAFLRFRDHGDSAALAEVFDLVAQQLLLVASHVAGRQQSAEDLLQETFLTAIQRADRYDGQRPLEPWLVGILVNVTRNDRRRRERELPSDMIELPPTMRQPSDAAIEAEFVASLHAAIDGLPVPQREVMTLNLVHGMTPTEIAHATSRPVGTVKSWIHRSLEVVRRRLPVSMGVTLGALLRGMDEVVRVRQVVVAEAARHVALATTATSAGAGASAAGLVAAAGSNWLRWTAAIAGAATLALVITMSLRTRDAAVPIERREVAEAPDVGAQRIAAEIAATSVDVDRAEVPVEPASKTATVHFVGAFAGEPFVWSGFVVVPTLPDVFLTAVPLTSGVEGRYTFRGMPYGTYQLHANRGESLLFDVDRPEVTVTVPMSEGIDIVGRVVDARGVPVAKAQVLSVLGEVLTLRLQVAVSDERGEFRVPNATRGCFLEARCDGSLSSCLRQVPSEGTPQPFELQLGEAAASVVVEVVDQRGAAVAGACLQLGASLPMKLERENAKTRELRLAWNARTDRNGRAVCHEAPQTPGTPLFVRAPGRAPMVVLVGAEQLGTSLRVEVRDGAVCSGVLQGMHDDDAAGVARATALGFDLNARPPEWFWPTCISDRLGNFQLLGVPEGNVLLQAQTVAGKTAESERAVTEGEQLQWSPTFGDGGVIRGMVRDEAGLPLTGAVVCAHAVACRAAYAELDEHGAFVLEGLPDRNFELLVQMGRDAAALVLARHYGVRLGEEVTLQLAPGRRPTAVLRGQLARLRERNVSLFESSSGEGVFTKVDEQGNFELLAPPGDYQLVAGTMRIVLRRDVTLRAGDRQDLGIVDSADDCTVRITAPSVTAESPAEVYAFAGEIGAMFGFLRLRTTHGELVLPPGRYRLLLSQGGSYVDQRLIEVASERDNEVHFEVATDGVLLRIAAVPTTPRVDLKVVWQIDGPDGIRRYVITRDRNQAAERGTWLDVVLSPGDYIVAASVPGGASVSMPVRLPLAAGAEVPTLRLP